MSTQYSCFECGVDVPEDSPVRFSKEENCEMPVCMACDSGKLTLSEIHELGLFMVNLLKNEAHAYVSLHPQWDFRPAHIILDGGWNVTPEVYDIMLKLVEV